MKSFILFLSICLKVCLCWHFSRQDNEFNYDVSITKNPWVVMIVRNGQDVVSYGTLFHERAVATTAAMNENDIFQLQVFADCHSLGDQQEIDHRICKHVRNIIEYHVLEEYVSVSSFLNLDVLILSSPFELTPTLNVVHFGNSMTVQLNKCTIQYPTLVTNPTTNETGALFYPSYDINFARAQIVLISSFSGLKLWERVKILPGNPLLCKPKIETDEWHAIGIIARVIGKRNRSIRFVEPAALDVLFEILKNSFISRGQL
ncbi:uncharacterized protein [Chelonus insularis]|uniref:uncharacterized protein n=1 Tax=Chelonus insularis TaxID=460826 RepID=UPI00158F43A6|nr:uncharacterized protein LOC118073894 [Chelonus insularis]